MVRRRMTVRAWRSAYASVVGTSHLKANLPCQDAGECRVVLSAGGCEVLVACVSDGAGSAARADAGSQLAVASFMAEFCAAAQADADLASIDRSFAVRWLEQVNHAISELAAGEHVSPGTSPAPSWVPSSVRGTSLYFQIGDGAMVVAGDGDSDYSWIFWPQHGEFAEHDEFHHPGERGRYSRFRARVRAGSDCGHRTVL